MNVLVIQTAFLGDAVLTLPLVQEIARLYPDANIDVLATPVTRELFEASPFVRKVFPLDKKGKHKSLVRTSLFALELKKINYDIIFSPHRSFRSALISKLINSPERISFDNTAWKGAYTNLVPYRKDFHEVKRNLSLLGMDYGENWRIRPLVRMDETARGKVRKFLEDKKVGKFVAIAPGSVWATKKYPSEYFAELIKFLLGEGFSIVMIGGKDDEKYCEEFTRIAPDRIFNSAGKFSVIESIELLSRCRFLLSNDSAPTHLAQAAGVRTFTIYVSTVPAFGFYPYLPGSAYESYDKLECKPCGIHGRKECPLGTLECGYALKPNIIVEKLKQKGFLISEEQ